MLQIDKCDKSVDKMSKICILENGILCTIFLLVLACALVK